MPRAVVVREHGGPEVLLVEERDPQPCGPGDVRVAVRSIAVNFRDVHTRRTPNVDEPPPIVPGSDLAGVVTEVGADVSGIAVGDEVAVMTLAGAYATEVVVPAPFAVPLPPGTDPDHAASSLVAGLTASFIVSHVGLQPGQTAAVWAAAGGVGAFLGGVLRAAGVRSIGITSSPEKVAVARAAHFDEVVSYREVDVVEAVRGLTDGRGVDVVFDGVAGPDFDRSFRMAADEGTVVLHGRAAGEPDLGQLPSFVASQRNLTLWAFFLGTYVFGHLDEVPGRLAALVQGQADGSIAVPITAYPFDQVAEAHAELESGRSNGKLVLRP
jgi:NADPH2:quinone reductase